MRHPAARRGRVAVGAILTRQLLWHSVAVDGDPEVTVDLADLLATAAHPMPPERDARYRIERTAPGSDTYRVLEDDDLLAAAMSAREARDLVHQRAHRRAFELASRKGWTRMHGGLVDVDGRRVAVLGPSGTGKTTLCVRLLGDGAGFQGDESLLFRQGTALAVPRPVHLKSGWERLHPELAQQADELPRIDDVALLDPARHLGRPWSITPSSVDCLVLLERRDGPVCAEPLAPADALPRVMDELFPVTESKSTLVREVMALLAGAETHSLMVGDINAMSGAIGAIVG